MKKLTIGLLVLVFGMGAVAYAMSELSVSGEWRYKITIAIETPEGIKTGSAVREVSNSVSAFRVDLPDVGNPAKVRGEAVVIDLGDRGLVFGIISDRSDNELYEAFPVEGASTAKGIKHFNSLPIGSKAEITNNIPRLVRFDDLKYPSSAELVFSKYKGAVKNNFQQIYGAGYKLDSVLIEIIEEDVTWSINKILPWIDQFYNKRLDGDRYGSYKAENKTANSLSSGAFSTGEIK